jgi:hypothetical protein
VSRTFRVIEIFNFRIIAFIGATILASCAQAQYGATPSNSSALRPTAKAPFTTYPSPYPGGDLTLARTAPSGRGWLSPAATNGQPLLYMADGTQIWIFPEESGGHVSPIGKITNGVTSAYGLFVDRYRNLYLTNWLNNTVEMYPPGSLNPSRVYTNSLDRPLYAVVNHQGNLYVGNGTGGQVTEFLAGSTTPRRVAQSDGTEADGMDFDRHGNLYVAYRNGSGAGIDRFSPDLQRRRNLGISLVQPQGVIVTHSGAIFVVETDYGNALDKFLPGQQTPEVRLIPPHVLTQLALARADRTLYASSLANAVYSTAFPFDASSSLNLVLALGDLGGGYAAQGMALSNGQRF